MTTSIFSTFVPENGSSTRCEAKIFSAVVLPITSCSFHGVCEFTGNVTKTREKGQFNNCSAVLNKLHECLRGWYSFANLPGVASRCRKPSVFRKMMMKQMRLFNSLSIQSVGCSIRKL